MKFWTSLNRTQQNQIIILGCAAFIGAYALWFTGVHKNNADLENKINRKTDRVEARKTQISEIKSDTKSLAAIKKTDELLEEKEQTFRRLSQRFVPVGAQEQQQKLRRELSELAKGLGMRVIRLEGSMRRPGDETQAPDFNDSSEISKNYGRTLLVFHAWGSYFSTQSFLEELDSLSYFVSPVNFRIIATEPRLTAQQASQQQQTLRVELVLAI